MTRALDWGRRNWVLLCGLSMFVGSDYKFRKRDATSSISGAPDIFVLLELGLYAGVAVYLLLRRASPPRAVRLPAPLVLMLGYLLVITVSLVNSPYPVFGAVRAIEMLIAAGLAIVVARQATRAELHGLAHGFLVLVAASVLYGIAVPSVPLTNQQVGRFTWLAVHPITAGLYVGVATTIVFVYLTQATERPGPRWPRPVYGLVLALLAYALLATHTRGAVLGAVLAVLLAHWSRLRSATRRVEYLTGTVLATTVVALFGTGVITAYFARGESTEQLATLNSRTDLWSFALDAFVHKPLYGWGVGASQGIFLDEIGLGGGHNMFVNELVDLGLVGLLVWAAFVVSTVARVLAVPRDVDSGVIVDRALLTGVLTMILVDGFFTAGPGGYANVGSTWLLLVAGWVTCLRRPATAGPGPARALARRAFTRADASAPAPALAGVRAPEASMR